MSCIARCLPSLNRCAGLSLLLSIIVLFSTHNSLFAQTEPNQTNASDLVFPGAAPCQQTLQACVDAAVAGTTIRIQSGIYTGSVTLNKAVSLIGAGAETTTLFATPGKRLLTISGSAVTNTVHISGLTLTGGQASGGNGLDKHGGAMLIEEGAEPQLSNLLIRDNQAVGMGGGMAVVNTSRLSIVNSHFINNQAGNIGGGLWSSAEYTEIASSTFVGNRAASGGGGFINGHFILQNTIFEANHAIAEGGGLYGGKSNGERDPQARLIDATFVRNTAATQGGGAFLFNSYLERVRFEANSAISTTAGIVSQGGGLAAAGVMTVTRSSFVGNQAQDGAALVQMSGKLCASNLLFANNQSSDVNGATAIAVLSKDAATRLRIMHITVYANAQNANPAIKATIGNIQVTNSIIVNHGTGLNNTGAKFTESNNLFHRTTTATSGNVTSSGSSRDADPLFVDAPASDFHLSAGSPAIDTGAILELILDIDGDPRPTGSAPDIGYDEAIATDAPSADEGIAQSNAVYLPVVVR